MELVIEKLDDLQSEIIVTVLVEPFFFLLTEGWFTTCSICDNY